MKIWKFNNRTDPSKDRAEWKFQEKINRAGMSIKQYRVSVVLSPSNDTVVLKLIFIQNNHNILYLEDIGPVSSIDSK